MQAASFYDSLSLADFKDQELKRIEERKAALSKLVANTSVLYRQDSLQKIAAMPEEERTAYINKLLRRILKEQGLSESTLTSGNLMPAKGSTDLFSASQTKGEWYFYNSTLRTQGAAQFRQVWGNRPNADNWRRFSAVNQQGVVKTQVNPNLPNTPGAGNNQATGVDEAPSFSGLLGKLPLTEDQLKVSNDSISNALFHVGTVLLNEMEDYLSSIDAYEKLRSRYPSYPNMAEVLFNLYYAYKKAGNETEAARIRQLLLSQFPESRYASILTTGKDPVGANRSQEITRAYEDIYNLFIEGRFEEAQSSKRLADSTYKTNYWQPQLLYIEAVYHIRQREDSIAKTSLQKLIGQEPNSPMAKKAQVMIDVLNRRKEIEEELSRYQIQQPVDDTTAVTPVVPQPIAQNPPARRDTVGQRPNVLTPIKDPVIARKDPVITSPPVTKDPVVTNPPVSRDSAISNPPVTKDTATTRLPVTNIPEKKDTAAGKPIVSQPTVRQDTVSKKPVVTIPPVQKDTVFNRRPRIPGQYYFDPAQKHFTVIILDKVDPLFVTEVQNAYSRFNRERYRGQVMQMRTVELDATRRMVLIGDFANSTDAVNYMQAAKNAAPTDVMPWLKAEKYSFYIITEENLPLFLEKKDTEDYRKFLVQNLPGKF